MVAACKYNISRTSSIIYTRDFTANATPIRDRDMSITIVVRSRDAGTHRERKCASLNPREVS